MVREITPSERAIAVEVLREAFGTVARDFGLTPENCPRNAAFTDTADLERRMSEGLCLYGCFEGDALVGVVGVKRLDTGDYTIEKLAVLPAYRHQSMGARLLNYALRVIRDAGGTKAHLALIDENQVLKEWYQGHGFVEREVKCFPYLPFRVCFMDRGVGSHE